MMEGKRTSNSSFFRQISTHKFNIILYNKCRGGNMKKAYEESLRMIKALNVKNEKEYNRLVQNYLILNAESLKYISQTRDFNKIIELAKEV